MTYTIDTIEDLIHVLDEHPRWRDALRVRLLTPEVLALPEQVARLAEHVNELVTEMKQFRATVEQRFDEHDQRFDQMDKRFDEHDQRLDKHGKSLTSLESRLDKIIDDLGPIKGAHARNAAIRESIGIARALGLRRTKALTYEDLWNLTDDADTTAIAVSELNSFRRADLVMEAVDQAGDPCYVAVEISFTANGRDTTRAIRNARLLTEFKERRSHAVMAGLRFDDRIRHVFDAGEVFWYQLPAEALQAE